LPALTTAGSVIHASLAAYDGDEIVSKIWQLITQRLNRINPRGAPGGEKTGDQSDRR
jgi:hypothetical protein